MRGEQISPRGRHQKSSQLLLTPQNKPSRPDFTLCSQREAALEGLCLAMSFPRSGCLEQEMIRQLAKSLGPDLFFFQYLPNTGDLGCPDLTPKAWSRDQSPCRCGARTVDPKAMVGEYRTHSSISLFSAPWRLSHPPLSWGGTRRVPDCDLAWHLSACLFTHLFCSMTEHVCLGSLSILLRVRRTNPPLFFLPFFFF